MENIKLGFSLGTVSMNLNTGWRITGLLIGIIVVSAYLNSDQPTFFNWNN